MVLFRHSESAHSIIGTEGVTAGEDSPRLLRMSPLRHSIGPHTLAASNSCDTGINNKDIGSWNGSISQSWRKLRRCCASLRASSAQNSPEPGRDALLEPSSRSPHILVNHQLPQMSASFRLPNSTPKKNSVQEVLRSKLNRIQVGLRKRRALSVQEVFHTSPTHDDSRFYVPSPKMNGSGDEPAGSTSLPLIDGETIDLRRDVHNRSRPRSRYREVVTVRDVHDHGYHSYDGYDSLPFEPEPDYDDPPTWPKEKPCRRWSVVDGLMRFNSERGVHDSGPPSIPPLPKNHTPTPQTKAANVKPTSPQKTNKSLVNINVVDQEKGPTIETIRNKIPKAKLVQSKSERARSHSPAKNKLNSSRNGVQTKDLTNKDGLQRNGKVVSSKSHYGFVGGEQRPEIRQKQEWLEELEEADEEGEAEEEESKFCTLPRGGGSSFTIRQVGFQKGPGFKALGFSIVGGRDSPKGSMGIYVKTVFPKGQANDDGTLKEGDEILAVNGKPLHGASHQEAINVFKQIKSGQVLLHIGRRLNKKRRENNKTPAL